MQSKIINLKNLFTTSLSIKLFTPDFSPLKIFGIGSRLNSGSNLVSETQTGSRHWAKVCPVSRLDFPNEFMKFYQLVFPSTRIGKIGLLNNFKVI